MKPTFSELKKETRQEPIEGEQQEDGQEHHTMTPVFLSRSSIERRRARAGERKKRAVMVEKLDGSLKSQKRRYAWQPQTRA